MTSDRATGRLPSIYIYDSEVSLVVPAQVSSMMLNLLLLLIFRLAACQDILPAPSGGPGSNYNYFYANTGGGNLQQLTAQINFDTDAQVDHNGASFQLNAYSPITGLVRLQQFVIGFDPIRGLTATVETLTFSESSPIGEDVFNNSTVLGLPITNEVPAGSQFTISVTNDNNGIVTGATFSVTSDGQTGSAAISMANISPNDLSPITAFTFNVGGNGYGSAATFSSGSGTFIYWASGSIQPLTNEPAGLGPAKTSETSNVVYSVMENASGTILHQFWGAGKDASGVDTGH